MLCLVYAVFYNALYPRLKKTLEIYKDCKAGDLHLTLQKLVATY